MQEVIKLREKNKKVFVKGKNLIHKFHAGDIHYKDGLKWKDIDLDFVDDPVANGLQKDMQFRINANGIESRTGGFAGKGFMEVRGSDYFKLVPLNTNKSSASMHGSGSKETYLTKYINAWPDADLMIKNTYHGLKMEILMKSKNAPKKYQFAVETNLTPDITVKPVCLTCGDEAITGKTDIYLKNEKSDIPFRIQHAIAIDSDPIIGIKNRRQCTMTLENNVLTIELDDTGLTYPITIDPDFSPGAADGLCYYYHNSNGYTFVREAANACADPCNSASAATGELVYRGDYGAREDIGRSNIGFAISGLTGSPTAASFWIKRTADAVSDVDSLSAGVITSTMGSISTFNVNHYSAYSALNSPTEHATRKTIASMTANTYMEWVLSNYASISNGTDFKLMFRASDDIDGSDATSSGANTCPCYWSEETGTANDPYLEVTEGGGGAASVINSNLSLLGVG